MRFSEMTPRQQLNFALCGDPEDDDTYEDNGPYLSYGPRSDLPEEFD